MREIKFRAWNDETRKFETNMPSPFDCSGSGVIFPYYFNLDYEQYTGLKDKNGKEIYEGDIIGTCKYYYNEETGEDEPGELEHWGVITYEAPSFGLWGEPIYVNEDKHFFEANSSMVVIGNIHENPELLGGKE